LGALALVVAGLNWPMLSVVAGVSMGLAILEKERAIDWAAGIALAGALVQIGLHHTDRKAALSAALLVVGAVVLFWEQRRPNGISVASLRAPRFAAALLLGALLWCAGQRAALAWKRDPVLIAWRDVQEWARLHTPPDAEFLVPPEQNGFELGSYRRAWVDHQQGAAVLWSPSFYAQWISRYPAVAALKNHAQFYSYARAHAIRYYVLQREQSRDGTVCPQETRLYENGEFEVYQLNPAEPHEQRRIILGDGACSE